MLALTPGKPFLVSTLFAMERLSSEPLSSPSPSPPPSNQQRSSAVPAKTAQVAILAKTATMEDSSDLSELSDEDDVHAASSGQRSEPTSATKRTRRRGALIPENMWDWAYKKKPSTSRSVSAQRRDDTVADDDDDDAETEGNDDDDDREDGEEEEEEEEEQDDDEDEHGSPSGQSPAPPAHQPPAATSATATGPSPIPLAPTRRGRSAISSDRASRDAPMSESEEEEEEEDTREEGEIDEHSDVDQQPPATLTSPSSRVKISSTAKRKRIINDDDEDEDDPIHEDDDDPTPNGPAADDDEVTEDEDDEDVAHIPISTKAKRDSLSSPVTPAVNGHADAEEDEDDAHSEAAASDDASIDIEWATQVEPTRQHPDWDDSVDFSFLPRRHAIARTRLLTRHAARLEGEEAEEPEIHEELSTARKLALDDAAALTLNTLAGTTLALEQQVAEDDAEADITPPDEDLEAAAVQDEDAEVEIEVEVEGEVAHEDEEDEEADDALEADTDLQPPQRAEALDILAGIEVKFAILRERIYIDKMEEVAAEEAMILNGTHPELLHFLSTLSQRKERRIKLASLRRKQDEQWIRRKRKADDDAVWSWWRVQKDGLRDDMVAEANGKRRRLEREKRSLDNRVNSAYLQLFMNLTGWILPYSDSFFVLHQFAIHSYLPRHRCLHTSPLSKFSRSTNAHIHPSSLPHTSHYRLSLPYPTWKLLPTSRVSPRVGDPTISACITNKINTRSSNASSSTMLLCFRKSVIITSIHLGRWGASTVS